MEYRKIQKANNKGSPLKSRRKYIKLNEKVTSRIISQKIS